MREAVRAAVDHHKRWRLIAQAAGSIPTKGCSFRGLRPGEEMAAGALEDGYRESTDSWATVLRDL